MADRATTSPEVELQNVREELDTTKKKLERYTELIANLYDELDSLRKNMCDKCRNKDVKPAAASSGGQGSRRPAPLWRRVLGRKEHKSRMATLQSDAASTKLIPLPTAATPVDLVSENVSANPTPTISPPIPLPLPVDEADNSLELKSDWSVVYNPDIHRTLDLHVANTITYDCSVLRVRFSRNGKYLAVGLESGETHIYDLKTLKKSVLVEHTTKEKPVVWAIQFSLDDAYIAVGLSDGRINIWDIARKRVLAMFKGHASTVFSVDFSPDGRFLVSASFDNTIRLWRLRDGSSRKLSDNAFMYNCVVFSPHGRYVFSGNDDHFLRVWDTRTSEVVGKWKDYSGRVWCVTLSKDGKVLVSGGDDMLLRYWDVSSYSDLELGSARCVVNTRIMEDKKEILRFEGHKAQISSISLSSDGRWIFSSDVGAGDGSIRIWDAKTAAWLCTLKGHTKPICGVDLSPTGRLLASGGEEGYVRLWKLSVTE